MLPTSSYLPLLDEMSPHHVPDFDHEKWTTTTVRRLNRGDVLAIRGEATMQPLVLTAARVEPPTPWETAATVVLSALHVDTGETVEAKLKENESVFFRCDLVYIAR